MQASVKPEDAVLVEGYPAGEPVDRVQHPEFSFLPDEVSLAGWDNMELFQAGDKLYDELDRINAELHDPHIPDQEKLTLRTYRALDLRPRIHTVAIVLRNQSLMKTLDKQQDKKPGVKAFVIAGAAHLERDETLVEYSNKFPYAVLTTKTQ